METAMNQCSNNNQLLHKVWGVELEILDAVDRFCKEHELKYSLFYGTLLGAVRHGGFIPWDDDVDLVMPRADYERFAELWKKEGPDEYVLVDRESYHDYPNNFMKVVRKHTTYLQFDHDRKRSFPKGIFVDIFPADRYAPEGLLRRKQLMDCMINMLFTRNYGSKTGGMVSFVERILLSLPPAFREAWRKHTKKTIQKWNNRPELPVLVPTTIWSCRKKYPAAMFDSMTELKFQSKKYPASAEYDQSLKAAFGDYKTLPPESERVWTHHPLLIDFEHDYEELQE